eukprot:539322-Alexandrium_andersonii.AAC.1
MSASLVGSEMCIRDSLSVGAVAPTPLYGAGPAVRSDLRLRCVPRGGDLPNGPSRARRRRYLGESRG